MQQRRLNNATTTTQQMQHNYACGTNRATTPFAKVIIQLVRLQPPSLKNNRAITPFAKVISDLTGYNPLRLTMLMQWHNLNATTSTS